MVTTSWFITATEARNNIVKDIAVHSEITGIEREILFAVQRGDYEVNVADNTLMTESSPDPVLPFTVNPVNDTLTVSGHNFRTGDSVLLSSTGELPPPLVATNYYYVIYIDSNTIKLATTKANSISGQPVSIDFAQGVSTIALDDPGAGYLATPRISFTGGLPTVDAVASAVLQRFGPVSSVSLLTHGAGYTDIPSATIVATGSAGALGPCTFKVVGVSVLSGGNNYNATDLVTVVGGVGTSFVARVLTVDGGVVTSVSIVQAGNYSTLPTLSGAFTNTSGSGSGCTFVLVMGISNIAITSSGIEYVSSPLVSIAGGGGSAATAITNVSGGGIASVVVTDPGSGYTGQPTVSVTSGSGATVNVRLVPTSVSTVQLIDSGGSTYQSVPSVSINSIGSGASALYTIMRAVGVQLINAGTGYKQGDQLLVSGGIGTQSTQIQVLTADNTGRILTYNLVNPGLYTVLPQLLSNNSVGGSGVGASWNLTMGVDSVVLNTGGSGYTTPPLLNFSGGGGAGGAGYATLSGGIVTGLVITDNGAGYTSVPTVAISGGSGATAQADLVPTSILSVSVIDGGSGYVTPPSVQIIGGGGQGATATAILSGDAVDQIIVDTAGSGYTSIPLVIIDGNATAEAVLTPTSVQSISVITPGTGYTHVPNVVISGAATARAIMTPTGLLSVDVSDGGVEYVSDPTLVLENGPGQTGATVPPVNRVNRSFSLDSIIVIEPGSGYQSTPTVVITPPETTGTTAEATASLGSGTGSLSIAAYQPSHDYYKVWKQQNPSSELLVRPMTDQMSAVIKYFTDLGYTINRYTNSSTGDTLAWNVKW